MIRICLRTPAPGVDRISDMHNLDWWWRRRSATYNIGLVFAGIGYLFMIGIESLLLTRSLSERIVQPNRGQQ